MQVILHILKDDIDQIAPYYFNQVKFVNNEIFLKIVAIILCLHLYLYLSSCLSHLHLIYSCYNLIYKYSLYMLKPLKYVFTIFSTIDDISTLSIILSFLILYRLDLPHIQLNIMNSTTFTLFQAYHTSNSTFSSLLHSLYSHIKEPLTRAPVHAINDDHDHRILKYLGRLLGDLDSW